jgi:ATP-dependent exoDNAse (exonuclease V) alpha subunit
MVTGHFRLETKIIGRKAKDRSGHAIPGRQSSVVAKAAYRSGQMLHDERAEKTFNYRSRTQEVAYSEILAPEIAPGWLKGESPESNAGTRKQRDTREKLWNTIERVEKRKDSQLAREFIASLPRGLNREQQIELVRAWCQSEFTSKGLVVDLAVHKSKGGNNPHAHILCTMRPATADGFGKKPDTSGKFNGRGAAGLGAKSELDNWRESWEKHVNASLEKAGRQERVDRRSLKDRGIDRAPEPKIGVAASAMKRRGVEADPKRFQLIRQVQVENEVRPFMRCLQKFGRTTKKPSRAIWLERSAAFLSRFRDKSWKVIQGVKERSPGLLESRRVTPEMPGPER